MVDHDVTLGEVHRRQLETLSEVRDMRKDLIGRPEYEADQEGIVRQFQESAKVHTQLETKVAAETVERKADVAEEAADREKGDARLEVRIDRIGGWVKYGVTTALGLIVTVIGWMLAGGRA